MAIRGDPRAYHWVSGLFNQTSTSDCVVHYVQKMLLVNTRWQVSDVKLTVDLGGLGQRHSLDTLQNVRLADGHSIGADLRALFSDGHLVDNLPFAGWTVELIDSFTLVFSGGLASIFGVAAIVVPMRLVIWATISVVTMTFMSVWTSAAGSPAPSIVLFTLVFVLAG